MPNRPLSGARILVVEDAAIVAFDLTQALTDAGADVVGPALTLAAACKHAANAELSAAVLDVQLGSETVFPVATLLLERGIPLAFHTGDANGPALASAWPATEILAKPASHGAIVAALAKLLAGRDTR